MHICFAYLKNQITININFFFFGHQERVMNLPEAVVTGTHNTEKHLLRRLHDYRTVNTDDDTVLNYFDELEFHPEKIGRD